MTDHATRAQELVREMIDVKEHNGFLCIHIGGLPMYHAGSIEAITGQLDLLHPILTAALTRAAGEAAQAAQPVWSKEKPTVDGLYLLDIGVCAMIPRLIEHKNGLVYVDDAWQKASVFHKGCRFAGPIPLPREA